MTFEIPPILVSIAALAQTALYIYRWRTLEKNNLMLLGQTGINLLIAGTYVYFQFDPLSAESRAEVIRPELFALFCAGAVYGVLTILLHRRRNHA